MEVLYVGSLRVDVEAHEQEDAAQTLLERFKCVPAFLPLDLHNRFYQGFCKANIWPLFHYMLPFSADNGGAASLPPNTTVFLKHRSASSPLGLDSALATYLTSPAAPVVDQAIRELCLLVKNGLLTTSQVLIELHDALEGCPLGFVPFFVKGIDFLVYYITTRLRQGKRGFLNLHS
ncbi:hypothetical protein ZIOFF_013948 [Zingiber officinale]|uniref:Uncharacterized protein n=1 Tax=Zingiber officinale TaxID=94328 RepID=A0A8J5HVA3_ZINOF|nr:hypothetical protein ZIOFF_013948 [Zingiber officinale]